MRLYRWSGEIPSEYPSPIPEDDDLFMWLLPIKHEEYEKDMSFHLTFLLRSETPSVREERRPPLTVCTCPNNI